jgi:hypothetical protein
MRVAVYSEAGEQPNASLTGLAERVFHASADSGNESVQ